jgi:hypothetical protein
MPVALDTAGECRWPRSFYSGGIRVSSGGDGDLRNLPEVERKQMLSDLLGEYDVGFSVTYSEHLIGDR